jgi:hypothetical protein
MHRSDGGVWRHSETNKSDQINNQPINAMTLKDKELVQDSWAKIVPDPDTVAELFYNRQ